MDKVLLLAKFLLPLASLGMVRRPRLWAILDSGLKRKPVLISAPAEQGKASLRCV